MQWTKSLETRVKELYDILIAFAIVLFLSSIIFNRPFIFMIIGALVAFIVISKIYDRHIGKQLSLENKQRTYRLFPGETAEVSVPLTNSSRLPIINGRLQFRVGNGVLGERFLKLEEKTENLYEIPMTLVSKGETKATIPFSAQKRGVTRINHVRYHFPHLINFASISLFFNPLYKTEFIVYPTPLIVHGVKEQFYTSMGSQRTNFSPFEDILSPEGTRDYVHSDPFHRIHWKASAKKQTLQTKVFEKNWEFTYSFVINITSETRLGNTYTSKQLESILSQVTYMCQMATEKGYPYEVFINLSKPGNPPYYYLYEGTGNKQLREALELIARIRADEMTIPIRRMLHRVDQTLYKPKTIVFFGELNSDVVEYGGRWKSNGMRVFHVKEIEGGATLIEGVGQEVGV
ncbi:DUF58 domain-containing protein [Pontibacillus yanchengensis]|uniref:Uncharacterized protein n=1 Tax=Pontibacillus yanchengensis Y32 TaxID=1385514 RepID=A0A0A2TCV1_9BACI|nr:DUF58 domain-containing protein [Pontibacillus yanchengensis]KGP71891.1 hypothetical protein N782_15860 [Pontibacillus yanchengensis Y32]